MSSGAPWWAFIVSAAVSIVSALFSWYFTHRSASKRDLQNWRRGELLKNTSRLIELSTKRHNLVRSRLRELHELDSRKTENWNTHADLVEEMRSLVDQIKLLHAPKLIERFEELVFTHQESEAFIRNDEYDEQALYWATMDPDQFEEEHEKVINEFHRTINERYFPGISKSDII